MKVEDLLKKSKRAIMSDDNLVSLFEKYYSLEFKGATAKICCAFSHYDKLKSVIFKKNNDMELKKYKVSLKPNDTLYYVEDKKVYRRRASRFTDDFLDGFFKNYNKSKFPAIDKFIEKIEVKEEDKLTAKETVELIEISSLEDLKEFESDSRKTVQTALEKRKSELNE